LREKAKEKEFNQKLNLFNI